MPEGKTIKQIAEEMGVSKQAIQKRIAREPLYTKIQPYIAMVAGTKYIADIGENLIKATFLSDEQAPSSIPTSIDTDIDKDDHVYTLISMLQAELVAKNQQIAELNARLADTTTALLAAQQTAHDAQALHAGTMRKQLTGGEDIHEEITPRRGLLARLFSKNKEG